jgi:hypothetical protein
VEFDQDYYGYIGGQGKVSVNISDVASLIQNGGEPMVLPLSIDWLDLYSIQDQRPTYDFHRKYAARAGVVLSGLTDEDGSPLGDVKLDVEANRNGVLSTSGGLTFTLAYGGETNPQKFTARYFHPDQFLSEYVGNNEYGNRMRGLVFEDGQGGKIEFKDLTYPTVNPNYCYSYDMYGNCVSWSSSYTDYSQPRSSKIYYNGLIHGSMFIDYSTGDWMASFPDAPSTLPKEIRVYDAR